jgi:hypothetical protein
MATFHFQAVVWIPQIYRLRYFPLQKDLLRRLSGNSLSLVDLHPGQILQWKNSPGPQLRHRVKFTVRCHFLEYSPAAMRSPSSRLSSSNSSTSLQAETLDLEGSSLRRREVFITGLVAELGPLGSVRSAGNRYAGKPGLNSACLIVPARQGQNVPTKWCNFSIPMSSHIT